jgi:hypothetical protein
LLFGFLTYFLETIAVPLSGMCRVERETACCKKIESNECCASETHPKQPGKPADAGCGNPNVCLDCPLCYNMSPACYKAPVVPFVLLSSKYVTAESNLIPGFVSAQWKPPNAG